MMFLNSVSLFKLDVLNIFVAGAISIFTVLTLIYSLKFMQGRSGLFQYYSYILLTGLAAVLAVFSNNLVLLLLFWGLLSLLLYLLINMGDEKAAVSAKKMLIIVGGSDALMILGIGIIYSFTQSLQLDQVRLELSNPMMVIAYFCIALGCFAKAGAAPLHSWIPDCAQYAPVPVAAYTIASLDKLLGIYLLARISLSLFMANDLVNTVLMVIGAITIATAVIMVLVQNNFKKLLGYCAVSQVGYMVLGIGTGNPIGIAGGLFHMLNHSIYESCLFFSAGNLEYRTKTTEFNALGGLAKLMPITYISTMFAGLALSGIPPLNGFVSKWMIYQGLVLNLVNSTGRPQLLLGTFCLIVAMFGSAFTLASFMKLLHGSFLGECPNSLRNTKEVSFTMFLPCLILTGVCILFGVGAFILPLKYFIFPAVSLYQPMDAANLFGAWSPVLVTSLLAIGLIVGLLVFRIRIGKTSLRRDSSFVGGEIIPQENRVTGTDFYNSIQEIFFLRGFYKKVGQGQFDIYTQGKKIFSVSEVLRYLHNGVLPTYLVWVLLGSLALFFTLLK